MADLTHTMSMTRDEYIIVARMIAHHATGDKLDRLYQAIFETVDGKRAENMGPLDSGMSGFYPGRPIVRAE